MAVHQLPGIDLLTRKGDRSMKRIVVLLMALMLMSSSLAEGVLVTCFSRAGENYNAGVIEEGNTAKLARVIAEQAGAELFN